MVLNYLGRSFSYNTLVQFLAILPDVGAPFFHLRLLEQRGVIVIHRQGRVDDLDQFLANGWPCVVPVKTHELPYWDHVDSDHAVVVIGMDPAFVFLNDPAFTAASVRVARGDFELAWFARGEVYAVLA